MPLLLLGPLFFPIILFGSAALLSGMTGISFHMQWPLTSLSHGWWSFLLWNKGRHLFCVDSKVVHNLILWDRYLRCC
jgi:hypothetical protein